MSTTPHSNRPAPDAYDHLWDLMPVFVAFVVVLVLVVAIEPDPARSTDAIRASSAQPESSAVAAPLPSAATTRFEHAEDPPVATF